MAAVVFTAPVRRGRPVGFGTSRRPALAGLVWALLGALVAIAILSPFRFDLGPLRLTVAVRPGWPGATRIEVPPAGEVRAATHRTPLAVSLRLERVELDALEPVVEAAATERSRPQLQRELALAARYAGARVVALGTVGGAVGPVLAGHRTPGDVSRGAAAGTAAAAALVAATALTFDPQAFHQPEFTGALRAAPWVIELVDEGLARLPELEARFRGIADNLLTLFVRLDSLPPLASPGAEVRVLVVSDLHNNPVALDFVRRIVELFAPDLVVDAGDLTDYGTALEGRLLAGLGELGIPYVLVPGNHDGPEELRQLEQLPGVIVLRRGTVEVAGLRIAGLADPGSDSPSPAEPAPDEVEAARRSLSALLDPVPGQAPPDLLVVHNPLIGRPFAGSVPALVTGHTHRQALRVEQGGVWIDPGSTGAAGIRGLEGESRAPYTLAILHFARDGAGWRVVAVDTARVDGAETGFRFERRLVAPPPPR